MTKNLSFVHMKEPQLLEYRQQLENQKNKVVGNLLKDHLNMGYHQVENTTKRLKKLMSTLERIDGILSAD